MTSKEKLQKALNHQEGQVPFDIGGTPTTGVHVTVVEKLREYYGLEKKPVTVSEPLQMLGVVEDDLKVAMGIDTAGVWNQNTILGFKDTGSKEWRTPWGQIVLVPADFNTTVSQDGYTYLYAQGDTNFPPAAKLPPTGYFFDIIIRGHSFDEDNYNVNDNLEEFGELDSDTIDNLKAKVNALENSGYGLVGNIGSTAFGDVALVPAPMLKSPKGLRDIEEWYVCTITNQDYLHAIFSKQAEIALKNLEKAYQALGNSIQVAYICGTDFGTQNAPFCSNETFRNLYAPYYKKINGLIHQNTQWKTFKHSCGAIEPLMRDMIDVGFDIINPVQWTAGGMDISHLKREYGKDIVFWGGGVDTQKTFPFGTPQQVREQVLECCEVLAKDGGFVFNTIHNIQALTPLQNVVAMVDALHEFNKGRG